MKTGRILGLIELYYAFRQLWREYKRNKHIAAEEKIKHKIRKDDERIFSSDD